MAFGAALHGTLRREESSGVCEQRMGQKPMQSWSAWWLIRTYLQSLGEVCFNIFVIV